MARGSATRLRRACATDSNLFVWNEMGLPGRLRAPGAPALGIGQGYELSASARIGELTLCDLDRSPIAAGPDSPSQ